MKKNFYLVIFLCVVGSFLSADESKSHKSSHDGNGFLVDFGYARYGATFGNRKWYSAPFESSQSGDGFNGAVKLAYYKNEGKLGAQLKGFYSFAPLGMTDEGNLKFQSYGGGADVLWRFSKYVGIYGGGGYEWQKYDNLVNIHNANGGYVNAGFQIGYRGFYLDVGYRYSLHASTPSEIGFPHSVNQSMINVSITMPLVAFALDMLDSWWHPTNSSEYKRCVERFNDRDYCLRIQGY